MRKRNFYPYILLLALVGTVSACRVGRNYESPDLGLPQQYQDQSTGDSSIAAVSWKAFFNESQLQLLIENTLKNNLDLKIAVQRLSAAQSYLKQARAAFYPSVTGQVNASTNIPSKNSLNGLSLDNFIGTSHIEDYTVSVGATWEADIWGKIRRQKEAAQASYLQTYEAVRAVQTTLVATVASGYFNLLMLDAQLNIAKKNVALSDTIVTMIRLQKEAGSATELAVQQAISQQLVASKLVPQLEQAIIVQQNALRLLGAEFPGTVNRIGAINDFPVYEQLSAGVPAVLLHYRPDVRAAEQQLIAANANVGVAQGSMYPSLSITATGGVNAFKASQWFTLPGSLFATVTGGITQPIFQRRALKTRLEVAKAQREEAELNFKMQVLSAVHEVSNSLAGIDKLKEQERIVIAQNQNNSKAVNNAKMLFTGGLANYLEVVTAQSNALQSELNLADVHRQQLQAVAELYRALGGGYE
ncbi:RND transporter [Chitinophaga caeni]|uniref:RND transporter n=1 Tax=Chitinophaga caeni TaxID=2029983 RepID=A0A291R1A1_9BACT|nr:efflux transporter outer membrane subunit [Chitinophaga caeni]ATL49977.1 RND transporter [Chitinophaga caeni]